MTPTTLPTRETVKLQARRLRDTLAGTGTPISHSAALEALAGQWGFRDWNTFSAALSTASPAPWQVGQTVSGRYLGHAFTGRIKSVRETGRDHLRVTLAFDEPVDVVRSDLFSSFRRQVSATIDASGSTHEKTSDGQPHLVLERT